MYKFFFLSFLTTSFFFCGMANCTLNVPKFGLENIPGYSIAYAGTYAILADGTFLVFYQDHILKTHVSDLKHWDQCSCYILD